MVAARSLAAVYGPDPLMPRKCPSRMTDTELQALLACLRTVPAKPRGGR